MTARPWIIVVALLLWLAVMLGITGFYLWNWLHTPHHVPPEYREFTVERGDSLNKVARSLHEAGVLRWPQVWVYYSRLLEPEPIKAGEYQFPDQATPIEILTRLQAGEVVSYPITFVEGRTFDEMLQVLQGREKLAHELVGLNHQEILEHLGLEISHPEGWFFPDTYYFVAGTSDSQILLRAHQRMRRVLELEWRGRAAGLPYTEPYEALIMASIVEKETGVAHERDEIAGVFLRRLEQGMRLQTDPTVIYGMGAEFDGNLTRTDLRRPTPYNTYTNRGLPPTPIAMPGREAIHAALHPASGDALYFVARGDGTHHFSATLEEHIAAVRQYQQSGRREDYRSAPPASGSAQVGADEGSPGAEDDNREAPQQEELSR